MSQLPNSVKPLTKSRRKILQQKAVEYAVGWADDKISTNEALRRQQAFADEVSSDTLLAILLENQQLTAEVATLAQQHQEAEARATELAGQLAGVGAAHKVEVLDILRDMRLPILEVRGTTGGRHQILGRNAERKAINFYCNQKAYEYDPQGIGPDPTEVGQWDTRKLPAAPPLEREAAISSALDNLDTAALTLSRRILEMPDKKLNGLLLTLHSIVLGGLNRGYSFADIMHFTKQVLEIYPGVYPDAEGEKPAGGAPLEGSSPAEPACGCQTCLTAYGDTLTTLDRIRLLGRRMIVCPDCGNKRCPKANFHGNACTNSNEVGQPGSSWENVKPFAADSLAKQKGSLHE